MTKIYDINKFLKGGDNKVSAVADAYDVKTIESKVKSILDENGVYYIPVNPLQIAKKQNIEVINVEFIENNIAGMISKEGGKFTIYVKHDDHPNRKRFTIAHELGHFFLHFKDDSEDATFVDNDTNFFRKTTKELPDSKRMEIEANHFAAELLMPTNFIKQEWSISNDKSVNSIARKFQVSQTAMGFRLQNLGLI